jgi:TrpR-related protein YerC/YecD
MKQKTEAENDLYLALSLCKNRSEVKAFCIDLCTPKEIDALSERLQIARLLSEDKKSYREISQLTGASTTTVGRVARFLNQEKHQGYSLILKRLKASK